MAFSAYCVCMCVCVVCMCVCVWCVCVCVCSTFPVVPSRSIEAVEQVIIVVLSEVHTSGTVLHHTLDLGGSLVC